MKSERLHELLIQNGYKLTKQRELIFEVLNENKGTHLSPEEIHLIVNKMDKDIGIATVYRTLLLFEELNIAYKLDFDDNRYRYEIADEDKEHQHHHLICNNCGKVLEVRESLLEEIEKGLLNKYGFVVQDHELKFYGLCSECQNPEEDKKEI
ncbi:Fur family transcriptional regulator [Gallicola sp. Sow4_E12]|uniref:Fur family transcriptional regulator n=1 Tax=Gallicola sp. Sow4_E12 TaxID=3438785 RepID=UPI003F934E7D